MKIMVEYLGHIKRLLNVFQVEKIELKSNALVSDLLHFLAEKHGDPFQKAIAEPSRFDLKDNFILTVNGFLLNQLNGINTKLKDGDHVVLMPIVSGG